MAEAKARAARQARALSAAPDSGAGGGKVTVVQGSVIDGDVPSVADVQAATEGIVLDDKVDFKGQWFRLAGKIPAITQLKFAHAAARGIADDDMEGLSAMYMFIRACLHRSSGGPKPGEEGHDPATWDPGDFKRFEDLADETCADPDELLDFVTSCMEKIDARPTRPPSGSSSPASTTSGRSRDGSSSRRVPPGAEDLVPIDELVARRR